MLVKPIVEPISGVDREGISKSHLQEKQSQNLDRVLIYSTCGWEIGKKIMKTGMTFEKLKEIC